MYRKKNIWKISEQTGQDMYVVPQLKKILLKVLNFNFKKKEKTLLKHVLFFPFDIVIFIGQLNCT